MLLSADSVFEDAPGVADDRGLIGP